MNRLPSEIESGYGGSTISSNGIMRTSDQIHVRRRSRSRSNEGKRRHSHRHSSSHSSDGNARVRDKHHIKCKCLGVFGMSGSTKEETIRDIFSKFGKLKRINIVFDTQTGRSRGFCFVYFKHERDAIQAKETCSQMEIDNRRVRVEYSTTTRPHEPTPGVYKGVSTRRDERNERSERHRYRSRSR